MTEMNNRQHIRHAISVNRDDPFVGIRTEHYESGSIGRHVDYSKTRRLPAPLSDRFTLIKGKSACQ
jgi:hypothetical protein